MRIVCVSVLLLPSSGEAQSTPLHAPPGQATHTTNDSTAACAPHRTNTVHWSRVQTCVRWHRLLFPPAAPQLAAPIPCPAIRSRRIPRGARGVPSRCRAPSGLNAPAKESTHGQESMATNKQCINRLQKEYRTLLKVRERPGAGSDASRYTLGSRKAACAAPRGRVAASPDPRERQPRS